MLAFGVLCKKKKGRPKAAFPVSCCLLGDSLELDAGAGVDGLHIIRGYRVVVEVDQVGLEMTPAKIDFHGCCIDILLHANTVERAIAALIYASSGVGRVAV